MYPAPILLIDAAFSTARENECLLLMCPRYPASSGQLSAQMALIELIEGKGARAGKHGGRVSSHASLAPAMRVSQEGLPSYWPDVVAARKEHSLSSARADPNAGSKLELDGYAGTPGSICKDNRQEQKCRSSAGVAGHCLTVPSDLEQSDALALGVLGE